MSSLTFVPTIRVALGLLTGFLGFARFIGITDGLPCTLVPTLGILVFTSGLGEELLGLTSEDLPRML